MSADQLPSTQSNCIAFVQCLSNVANVAPTLDKCYTNVLCLLCMWWILIVLVLCILVIIILMKFTVYSSQYSRNHTLIDYLGYL